MVAVQPRRNRRLRRRRQQHAVDGAGIEALARFEHIEFLTIDARIAAMEIAAFEQASRQRLEGAKGIALGATMGHIPISTTHAITGGILGVGTTKGVRSVRWIWGQRIVMAWVLTLPCAAFMAGVAYLFIHWAIEPLFR